MSRQAWASGQSDQHLCYHFLESIICKLATGEISIFRLVSVAEETGLKLALYETRKTGFLAMRLVYKLMQDVKTVSSLLTFELLSWKYKRNIPGLL